MKKYYCPYCGELTRKWYHKLSGKATNFVVHYQKNCNTCGHYIPVRQHFTVWIIFILEICLIIASICLFTNGKAIYGYISIITYILLFIVRGALQVVLGKFVKYDDDDKGDRYYKCVVELTDNVKHHKLYFYGTSVGLLNFEKSDVLIPVRIEASEIGGKSCKCKIAFVSAKPTEEFEGKKFALIDNGKMVGKGRFE